MRDLIAGKVLNILRSDPRVVRGDAVGKRDVVNRLCRGTPRDPRATPEDKRQRRGRAGLREIRPGVTGLLGVVLGVAVSDEEDAFG